MKSSSLNRDSVGSAASQKDSNILPAELLSYMRKYDNYYLSLSFNIYTIYI